MGKERKDGERRVKEGEREGKRVKERGERKDYFLSFLYILSFLSFLYYFYILSFLYFSSFSLLVFTTFRLK